jgi:kynurenine--oxoglutarate transaminase/cysteine-S-conjugate beta-lyase/glutamine--phenylpyruvate transaminase
MPDFGPPQHLIDALCDCSQEAKNNQYTRSQGHVRLVTALANMYSQLMGRQLNPMTDVVVSMGAYSILSHAINAFLEEGDEIVLVEPFFDCYQPMAKIAGAKTVFVPLRPQGQYAGQSKDWVLDPGELEAAFSRKTKMIIVNNPNNPLGKLFTTEELTVVAELCKRYDVICLMDEVYEWLTYSGTKHVRMATLPGMWERTITVGSAGKTFSATGWKMGWGIGPEHLVKHMQTMHANTGYCYPTLLQEAVARALEVETARLGQPDCYFTQLAVDTERKRDEIAQVLREVGLEPIIPDSGYFMMADTTPLGDSHPPTSLSTLVHSPVFHN